jgi:hypothetical protein
VNLDNDLLQGKSQYFKGMKWMKILGTLQIIWVSVHHHSIFSQGAREGHNKFVRGKGLGLGVKASDFRQTDSIIFIADQTYNPNCQ